MVDSCSKERKKARQRQHHQTKQLDSPVAMSQSQDSRSGESQTVQIDPTAPNHDNNNVYLYKYETVGVAAELKSMVDAHSAWTDTEPPLKGARGIIRVIAEMRAIRAFSLAGQYAVRNLTRVDGKTKDVR